MLATMPRGPRAFPNPAVPLSTSSDGSPSLDTFADRLGLLETRAEAMEQELAAQLGRIAKIQIQLDRAIVACRVKPTH